MPTDPFWARPKFVLAAIFGYLALHFAIRLALPPTLLTDDAEQALFAQRFAWSYRYRAPPLFTWLLVALTHFMPIGAVSIGLLRYAFLGIAFVFAYLSARRLIADPRLSALAVYSFAAIHTFSESSHRELTHATALAALIAVAWYLFLRLYAHPRLGWYLALGAATGLGMLAKWNFVVLAAALPLAALLRRETRRLVLNWGLPAAGAIAAAIVLPTVVATLRAGPPAGEDVGSVLGATARGLAQISAGTFRLFRTAIVYPEPLFIILVILLGLPLWRGILAGPPDAPAVTLRPDARFIGMTLLIGLALLWALVPLVGATAFAVRYLYPVLFIFPTWLFMLIERGEPSSRALGLFNLVMAALVLQVAADRLYTGRLAHVCGSCIDRAPFVPLAAALKDTGYNGTGTIIADGSYVGGNLRVEFPAARVIDPAFGLSVWPKASGAGPCLLVWRLSDGAAGAVEVPANQAEFLVSALSGHPEAPHQVGELDAPYYGSDARTFHLGYRLYPMPNGACR